MTAVVERLLEHYSEAAQRMRELPFYNTALDVELVGWCRLRGEIEGGVLITPWCLNLLWVPGAQNELPAKGERCILELHDIEYEGVVAQIEPALRFASAALLSQTQALEDQAAARAVAKEVMALLTTSATAADSDAVAPDQPVDPQRRALFRRVLGGQ